MSNWDLIVDETGPIERLSERVGLVGLLLTRNPNDVRIRAEIAEALPGVVWPPHAAWLRLLPMQLAFRLRHMGGRDPNAAILLTKLHEHAPGALALLNAYVHAGEQIPGHAYELFKLLEREFQVWDKGYAKVLKNAARRMMEALQHVLAQRAVLAELYWFASTESYPGRASRDGLNDRYQNLLAQLAQRVRDVLSCYMEPSEVHLLAHSRPGLTEARVRQAVDRGTEGPGAGGAVTFADARLTHAKTTHLGWAFMADYAANQVGAVLRAKHRSLAEVEKAIQAAIPGTKKRMLEDDEYFGIPHVAVYGDPSLFVDKVRTDGAAELAVFKENIDSWMVEQARDWAESWT